jgi:hypothetical protein
VSGGVGFVSGAAFFSSGISRQVMVISASLPQFWHSQTCLNFLSVIFSPFFKINDCL